MPGLAQLKSKPARRPLSGIFRDLYVDEGSPKTSLLPYRCNWSSSTFVIDIRSKRPSSPYSLVLKKTLKIYVDSLHFAGKGGEETVEKCGRRGKGRLRARPKPLMTVEPRLNLHVNPGGGIQKSSGERVKAGKFRGSEPGTTQTSLKKYEICYIFFIYTHSKLCPPKAAAKQRTHSSYLILRLFE